MARAKGLLVLLGVMGAACDAGQKEVEVTQRVAALTGDSSANVMGFENASDWSSTTPGVVLGLSSTHTQGTSSLAVTPSPNQNWNPINSVPLSTLAASPTLAIDVMLPTQQPNPYWFGAVQLYITCPSHNVYNDYLADVELTGMPVGVWNTLNFPLPLNNPSPNGLLANLLASGYSDLFFTVVLNVPMPAGTYLLDNLRFVPVGATACGGQPNGTSCNDGNACTSGETCNAGACVPGSTVTCAATDQCHQAGQCDPQTGACGAGQPVPDSTPCNDGDLCTSGKSCQRGVCGGGQPTCQDGDPCTVDSCNPSNGSCQFTAMTPDQCTAFFQANPPEVLGGRIAFATQPDNNRCVPHASRVLDRLNATGELMGWQFLKNGYEDVEDQVFHSETLVRLPYFDPSVNSTLDGSYFISTYSHSIDDVPYHSLGVAHLAFKTGNQGRMLLTNRAFSGGNHTTAGVPDWDVAPHPDDGFVPFNDGTTLFTLDPQQNHPGGGSALGWYAVVGTQIFDDGEIAGIPEGGSTPPDSQTKVVTLNLSNPLSPVITSTFVAHQDPPGDQGNSAFAAAITKLNNGHFLLGVEKDFPTKQMEFYVSTSTSLDDPHPFGPDKRDPDTIIPLCGSSGATTNTHNSASDSDECFNNPYGWQSFNFINDCNGEIYVLGMRGNVGNCNDDFFFTTGECNDVVDNFKIQVTNSGAGYSVQVISVDQLPPNEFGEASKHMYCSDNAQNDQCDLNAAAGSYVDPQGQVIIYASEYDPDGSFLSFAAYGNGAGDVNGPWRGQSCPGGTCGIFGGFYRGMEFHERHGNGAVGSACPTLDQAWVEFYEGVSYNAFGDSGGQMHRTNYVTRDERDGYLGSNDFNDKAHSVRWCVPPGSSIQVFKDVWTGGFTYLNGSGQVMEVADLSNFTYQYSTDGSGVGANTTGSITTFQFVEGYTDPNGIRGFRDLGD